MSPRKTKEGYADLMDESRKPREPKARKAREFHICEAGSDDARILQAFLVEDDTNPYCLKAGCVLVREVLPRRKPAAKKGK